MICDPLTVKSEAPPHSTDHGSRITEHASHRVWDLPTRLFHWSLLVCVVGAFTSAKIGGNAMVWHMRFGYTVLALVLFRILWGLAGDRHARFASFVRGPRAVWAYLRGAAPHGAGHNPAGGWSVLALLFVLLTQASTGLFASDDIATEGPLAKLVSGAWVSWATRIHHWNETVIIALVTLHVLAIVTYAVFKRDNLVRPMIVGDRPVPVAPPARDDATIRIRAAILAGTSAALVGYVVTL